MENENDDCSFWNGIAYFVGDGVYNKLPQMDCMKSCGRFQGAGRQIN